MSCTNCQDSGVAYTLQAHVTDSEAQVELPFCSAECLDEWV